MKRFARLAPACVLAFTVIGCGPLTTPMPARLDPETQQEIDDYWDKLTAGGGAPGRCGWLKDKFGLSWQIVPKAMGQLLGGGGDPARAGRVVQAMLQMNKLDLQRLQQAYDGE